MTVMGSALLSTPLSLQATISHAPLSAASVCCSPSSPRLLPGAKAMLHSASAHRVAALAVRCSESRGSNPNHRSRKGADAGGFSGSRGRGSSSSSSLPSWIFAAEGGGEASRQASMEAAGPLPPSSLSLVPVATPQASKSALMLQPLSKEDAMSLALAAAVGSSSSTPGWTTFSGLQGPSLPSFPPSPLKRYNPGAADVASPSSSSAADVERMERGLGKVSPRRTKRVEFTCNKCGERTLRAINPHAYNEGTVFVQCKGCEVYHKLVDHLNLFHELAGPVYHGADSDGFGVHHSEDVLGADSDSWGYLQ